MHVLLMFGAVLMVFPMIWMLLSSFKSGYEFYSYPPSFFPVDWRLMNYADAYNSGSWSIYFFNSVVYSGATIFGQLFTCFIAAYAYARLEFKGKNVLFILTLATMMIPGQVTIISVYLILSKLGWIDTYPGLLIPGLTSAFGIFLLRQFLMAVPTEMEEAASIDGAKRYHTMLYIVLPLIKPAMISLFIFTLIGSWNEYFWPLIITSSPNMRTVQIGLAMFRDMYGIVEYGEMMAASVIVMLPLIVGFIFAQKQFIEGIATSGLKG